MKLTTLLCVYKFCSPTSLFKYIYKIIYTQQQGCQFHSTKSFSPIFISSCMGMSKNENEARIYTGGRESARIFLLYSASSVNRWPLFRAGVMTLKLLLRSCGMHSGCACKCFVMALSLVATRLSGGFLYSLSGICCLILSENR